MLATSSLALLLLGGLPDSISPAATSRAALKILEVHCSRCHNAETTRGGFDLSSRDAALLGGATSDAIVPGELDKSGLLARVMEGSMPPEKDGRRLTGDEIAILKSWIAEGAPWSNAAELAALESQLPTVNICNSPQPVFQRQRRPSKRRIMPHRCWRH